MTQRSFKHVLIASSSLLATVLTACTSEKKPEPPLFSAGNTSVARVRSIEPGIAGGTIDETATAAVTVGYVDPKMRRITLANEKGEQATFSAAPEIRNLDQLKKGDKLTATLNEQLVVYVRSDRGAGGENGDVYGKALEAAPKGATPGAIFSENYQLVANVTAIDSAKRTATLTFSDGTKRLVPVRDDVDLGRYTVGDRVIIQVTTSLSVLASRP